MLFFAPVSDGGIISGKKDMRPRLYPLPGHIVILAIGLYKVWYFRMYAVAVWTLKPPKIKWQLTPGFIFDVSAFAVFYFYSQIAHRAVYGMVTIPYL